MKKRITVWRIIAGAILLPLGAFFIYGAIFTMPEENKKWMESSVKAAGTVIDVRRTYRNKVYCDNVTIQYTAGSRVLTFTPYDCFSSGSFTQGKNVAIRYSKNDPSSAYIDTGENDNSTSLITMVLGIILLASGVLFLAGSVKKEEQQV